VRSVLQLLICGLVIAIALAGGHALEQVRTSVAGAPVAPPLRTGPPDAFDDPAHRDPPPATPVPTLEGWPARSAQEVARNIVGDPFAAQQLQDIARPGSPIYDPSITTPVRLGQPVFVASLSPQHADVWLTPVMSGARTVAVIAAPARRDGTATADFYSGYAGAFVHGLSRDEALARGSDPRDAGLRAHLVWSKLGERQGYPTGLTHPVWKVVRASGSFVLVLTDGTVVAASDLY
jgi:hypothetical protein